MPARSDDDTAPVGKETAPSPGPVQVGFGPTTGLFVESDAGRLELPVFTWLRAQTDTRVSGGTDLAATVPLVRPIRQGSLIDDKLHLFFQPEFGSDENGELLDLFAEWTFDELLRIRAGQFRTPDTRAFITPLSNLQLAERGLVVDQFRLGRDTGAMASGAFASGLLHYDIGAFNGAEMPDLGGDRDSPSVIGRTEIRLGQPVPYDQAPSLTFDDPHGVTFGFGGAYSRRAIKQGSGPTSGRPSTTATTRATPTEMTCRTVTA